MQILIIEDEKLAAERLSDMVKRILPEADLIKPLDSIRNAVLWFDNNPLPDLILLDVQLADGLCFEIFEKVAIDSPVIFTTAYNEYALKAFKVNSIDYLLKPIDEEELKASISKYKKYTVRSYPQISFQSDLLKQVAEMIKNPYRSRFVIKIGEHIKTIATDDIVFFYSSEKSSFLRSITGRDYALDYSLDQLEEELDPDKFFRANRKFIVALPYLADIISYSGNRLKLILSDGKHEEIIVSREKVTDFKKWLDK